MSQTWKERYEVQSHTDVTKRYTVARKDDGSWGCSCPRWIFGKPRSNCKHILAMIYAMQPLTQEVWSMEMTGRKMRGFDQERSSVAVVEMPMPMVNESVTATVDNELFTVSRKFRF